MKYILDACVAIKWALPEVLSDRAEQLRDDFRADLHKLLAPDVFAVEIAHAFTRAERQGRMVPGEAAVFWAEVMLDCPVLVPTLPLLPRAVEIASQMRIGVYDCLYVALAEREGCELVTADDKLVSNLQGKFPFLVALSGMP